MKLSKQNLDLKENNISFFYKRGKSTYIGILSLNMSGSE